VEKSLVLLMTVAEVPARLKRGLMTFSFTSDGTDGPHWKHRLERQGYDVKYTELNQMMFRPENFKPTKNIQYELVILPGHLVSGGTGSVLISQMYDEARRRKLFVPNSEVGCYMREIFSYENIAALGLSAVFIGHKPVVKRGYYCNFLMDERAGGKWMSTDQVTSMDQQRRDDIGFVFCSSRKRISAGL
jgi:hypothetical protein